jgi:hypothetical protein
MTQPFDYGAKVPVTANDLGSLLLGTVRYALRVRGAYTVEYTAKLLRRYFPIVDGYEQRQIMTEIEIAVAVPRDLPPTDVEQWSALAEEIRPPKAPFTVEYRCSKCKADGVKLWRGVHGCEDKDGNKLLCAACLSPDVTVSDEGRVPDRYDGPHGTDQVDGWLPAVPVDDTFWGYSSVPTADVRWWKALPTYRVSPHATNWEEP